MSAFGEQARVVTESAQKAAAEISEKAKTKLVPCLLRMSSIFQAFFSRMKSN
eukprot:gene33527-38986_t